MVVALVILIPLPQQDKRFSSMMIDVVEVYRQLEESLSELLAVPNTGHVAPAFASRGVKSV